MSNEFMLESEDLFEQNLDHLITDHCRKLHALFTNSSGKILCGITNPYMFRCILQRKPLVLKELLRHILSVPEQLPIHCEITNPIALGRPMKARDKNLHLKIEIKNFWKGTGILSLEREGTGYFLYTHFTYNEEDSDNEAEVFSDSGLSKTEELLTLFSITDWETLQQFSADNPIYLQYAEALADLNTHKEVILNCMHWENYYVETLYQQVISGNLQTILSTIW